MQNDSNSFLHPQLKADTIYIGSFSVSDILLMNDSRYPWLILVPRRANISDLTELRHEDVAEFNLEILEVARIVKRYYQPDRINIAMLGNIVPQLHCHIIARFTEDFAWAKPVWGVGEAIPYSNAQIEPLVATLKGLFFH